jgi:Homeodomain-like domain
MNDELSKRQAAIRLRVAGESIPDICRAVQRGESWLHKWWQRYLTLGPEGLYDLTRAMARAQRIGQIPADPRQNDVLGEMSPFEAHGHASSPSLVILDDRGRSYRKWRQRKIATQPARERVAPATAQPAPHPKHTPGHQTVVGHTRTNSPGPSRSIAPAAAGPRRRTRQRCLWPHQ